MWSKVMIIYAEVNKCESRCFNWKTRMRSCSKRMRCGVLGRATVVLC